MNDRPDHGVPPQGASADLDMDERSTDLPGFGTWRGVYVFVFIVFVACVLLLKAFELAFS